MLLSKKVAVAQSRTIWSVLEGEAVNIGGKPGRYQVCKPGLHGLPYADMIAVGMSIKTYANLINGHSH